MVKKLTWLLGIIFIVIGILGFVNNPILGLFEVDTMHNSVHLLSGILALAAAASGESLSRLYLIVFGIVYGVVAIVGFTMAGNILGLFTTNAADNYLHAAIALVCLAVGFRGNKS